MNRKDTVAVCSRSFCRDKSLRESLEKIYENVEYNEKGVILEGDELVDFLQGQDKAIVGLEPITSEVLHQLPQLSVISKYGVGLDNLDLKAMRTLNKKLGHTPGVNRRSVSELVLTMAIILLRRIDEARESVKDGHWRQIKGKLLSTRIFGIVGCGNIGKDLIDLLEPFGCQILVNDIVRDNSVSAKDNVKYVELEELLGTSDIISLHTPLNESTINMLNAENMRLIKPSSIIINAARGGLIDEDAITDMLRNAKLAGAAFDVFLHEPPVGNALLSLENVIVTPHIGGSSIEAVHAMGMAAIKGLDNYKVP